MRYFREAKVDRVFLALGSYYGDREQQAHDIALLRENIAFYRNPTDESGNPLPGYEVGVWVNGLGHGGQLCSADMERTRDITRIRCLLSGAENSDSLCPLDPIYRNMYASYLTELAALHPDIIMIDDDLRLAGHGAVSVGCACERHMAEYNRRAKEAGLTAHGYTREALAELVYGGKPTPERKLWLELMGDTLCDYARDLRAAVDAADPTVRLGHCACLPTWDQDGVDSITLAKIFAGNTAPYLRLIGAPYWNCHHNFRTTDLGAIINLIRMERAWCTEYAPGMELMAEGDVYPRPRFEVPASYLECYHQALTADGLPDILKYMFVYDYEPSYEEGYLRLHCGKEPLRAAISDAFADTEAAGIFVYEKMQKLCDTDLTGISPYTVFERFTPASANYISRMGLPASYEKTAYTPTTLVFGENAKYIPREMLNANLIVDAPAARYLLARGVALGITAVAEMAHPERETLGTPMREYPVDTEGTFYRLTPTEDTAVLGTYDNGAPSTVCHRRADGTTVLVYAFDMESVNFDSVFMKNYARRRHILDLQKEFDLPVCVPEAGLFVICRKNAHKTVVGMWNFGMDIALPQDAITLDRAGVTAYPIGTGHIAQFGDTVSYKDDIAPFCFGGFAVLH